jgi:hypothetical protein
MRTRVGIAVALMTVAGSAEAGAFGAGPFENDDALDFSTQLLRRSDLTLVYQALRQTRDHVTCLDAPEGSAAIAAAEVVAALRGHPCKAMPEDLQRWIKGQKARPTPEQVALAKAAVVRVAQGKESEFAELWADARPADHREWKAAIQDLLRRLRK